MYLPRYGIHVATSIGAFASFRNTRFDRIGVEVEFELFRKW